jgi:hypothetical protein
MCALAYNTAETNTAAVRSSTDIAIRSASDAAGTSCPEALDFFNSPE